MKHAVEKTLVIVRHSKALQDNFFLEDIDRPLTERGYADAYRVSKWLADQMVSADLMVSSPAVRAISTGFIFARQLNYYENELVIERKLYDARLKDILKVIHDFNNSTKCVFIFGHNPGFEDLANLLSGNEVRNFPTTGVCIIECTAIKWSELSAENCKWKKLLPPSEKK